MKPSTFRALKLLRAHESVTTHDLLEHGVGARYSARIKELRDLGCVITARQERPGSWRYRLVSEPKHLAAVPATTAATARTRRAKVAAAGDSRTGNQLGKDGEPPARRACPASAVLPAAALFDTTEYQRVAA